MFMPTGTYLLSIPWSDKENFLSFLEGIPVQWTVTPTPSPSIRFAGTYLIYSWLKRGTGRVWWSVLPTVSQTGLESGLLDLEFSECTKVKICVPVLEIKEVRSGAVTGALAPPAAIAWGSIIAINVARLLHNSLYFLLKVETYCAICRHGYTALHHMCIINYFLWDTSLSSDSINCVFISVSFWQWWSRHNTLSSLPRGAKQWKRRSCYCCKP